ncbi:hypothetical protein DIX60_02375 [Streptococcus iniae]|uniref:DUF960 domain-containing protein n=1 Tax=Streptococcus iniae TaxID=1346 RepID=UPI0008DAA90A|nr:DUF960 domain-containing protein [Streptococcus iniae]OHX26261.1 hypothetical protein BKX95_11375 [Streptococcus iniae]RLV28318.1 hypothetical protein DIX60_02375 [Streptococcus iniae]
MAFQKTQRRYASFGAATALPKELIDHFWYIIDNYLKGVFPLENLLIFTFSKSIKNRLVIEYQDKEKQLKIAFDTHFSYDPFLPLRVYIVDNNGIETLLLDHEIN